MECKTRRNLRQEGGRKGGIQESRFRIGGMWNRDAGKKGYMNGGMQESTEEGKEGDRTGGI